MVLFKWNISCSRNLQVAWVFFGIRRKRTQAKACGYIRNRRFIRMIRGKLWFRCAAMHDPVTPIVIQPALIGWEAKQRKVELLIERAFHGEELVRRMKGWITVDPSKVIETVNRFGRLKVLDDKELVIEVEKIEEFESLQKALQEGFGNEVEAELIRKK